MNNKLLITATLFIAATALFGQKEYLDGYLIMEQGDTVYGKLAVLSDLKSCSKIKFKDLGGNNISYGRTDAKAYKRGNEYYVRKKYERPKVIGSRLGFMKVLVNGEVKLYRYLWMMNVMMADGGFASSGIPEVNYYIEKDDKFLLVKKSGFKKKMSVFFSENEKLSEKILNKKLGYVDIEMIVKVYNTEWQQQESDG